MDHDKDSLLENIPANLLEEISEIVNVIADLIKRNNLKQLLREKDDQSPFVQEYYFQLDMLQSIYDEMEVNYYGPMPLPFPEENNKKVKKS